MHKNHKTPLRLAIALMVTALAVLCCEGPEPLVEHQIGVSVRTPEVENGKGSTFVSVKTEGKWTLSLEFEEGTDAWASLSAISGTGERNDVILSYEANDALKKRTLTIKARCGSNESECTVTQAAADHRPVPPADEEPEPPEEDPDNTEDPEPPAEDPEDPENPEDPEPPAEDPEDPENPEDPEPPAEDPVDPENPDDPEPPAEDPEPPTEDPEPPAEDPEPPVASNGPTWLELPAKDDPNLKYLSHSFKYNGREYRNYSFAWSQKDLVSLWVAYPLCRFYTNGNAGRTNQWAYDPLLGEDSSLPMGGYAGDYARGHLLMSNDRQVCFDANAQTFYGTNIAPQANRHNEGIWLSLENKVQTLAENADTAYVVSGVVVKGSTETTYDSAGKKMTVPVAFYKAVLMYDSDSTIDKWMACGFYTEHKEYPSSTKQSSVAMSIDELEKKLGMDFFVNLEAKVGKDKYETIEAKSPVSSSAYRKYWFPEE